MSKSRRHKYKKIPLSTKLQLYKKVLIGGQSIKKVATEFKINYSTAKTLIRFSRLQNKVMTLGIEDQTSNDEKSPIIAKNICGYSLIQPDFKTKTGEQKVQNHPNRIQIVSRIITPIGND